MGLGPTVLASWDQPRLGHCIIVGLSVLFVFFPKFRGKTILKSLVRSDVAEFNEFILWATVVDYKSTKLEFFYQT
jgi:hypothetical protein